MIDKLRQTMITFAGLDDSSGITERIALHLSRNYPMLDPQAFNPKPVVVSNAQLVGPAQNFNTTFVTPTLTLYYAARTQCTFDNTAGSAAHPWTQPGVLMAGTLTSPDGGLILGTNTNTFSFSAFAGDNVVRLQPFWATAQQVLTLQATNNEPIALEASLTLFGVGCYTAAGPII
jgi:hypothetical protein